MVAMVPVYLSEISLPQNRGLIAGISECGISVGTMMSNWVGFACSYALYGATQWHLPLGLQIPFGVIMFAGLTTFMPNSPRLLIRVGEVQAARREYGWIYRGVNDEEEVGREFARMKGRIKFGMERDGEIWRLFSHRVLV